MTKLFCARCGLRSRLRDLSCTYCQQLAPTWQHVVLFIIPTSVLGIILLQLFY